MFERGRLDRVECRQTTIKAEIRWRTAKAYDPAFGRLANFPL
jgi:hypothetical protein